MKSSHVAVGTCHVLPNALFRWYSVGSCVILAVCVPENPIICSRIAAGARLVVPCCDVTRYLVLPAAPGAGVVRQRKRPWFWSTGGAECVVAMAGWSSCDGIVESRPSLVAIHPLA